MMAGGVEFGETCNVHWKMTRMMMMTPIHPGDGGGRPNERDGK